MKKNKEIPEHILKEYGSLRNWKKDRRKKWKALISALNEFNRGCIYIPNQSYQNFNKAYDLLKGSDNELKNWWKKS